MRSFDVILHALTFAVAGGALLAGILLPWHRARMKTRPAQSQALSIPEEDDFDPPRINFATGLPMHSPGGFDMGGNPYGGGPIDHSGD